MVKDKKDKASKKKREKPVSLWGLTHEDALDGLMKTPKPKKEKSEGKSNE